MSERRSLLAIEHFPGLTVAHVAQRSLIGSGEVEPLVRPLLALTEASADRIVLDLHEVSALSSLALAVLVQLFRRLDQDGRGLTFSRVQPPLLEVFRVCRLDTLLDVRGCPVPLAVPAPEAHEAAFLEDIVGNPEEDAPRMIFADWLEDRGEPGDTERATFIRLQCAVEESGSARGRYLLETHEQSWVGPLRSFLRSWRFRRGFIDEVSLTAGAFLDHAVDLFRRAPARRVRLVAVRGFLPLLSSCPHLARIGELSVDPGGSSPSKEEIQLLARSPHLAGVQLDLSGQAGPSDHAC